MFDKIFGKADAVIRGKNDRDRVWWTRIK
jgi:hypothetical protein